MPQPRSLAPLVLVLALAAGLEACSREGKGAATTDPAPSSTATSTVPAGPAGYLAAPEVQSASRGPDGVEIRGLAPAKSQVVLRSPDGRLYQATAGVDGRWSLRAPTPDAPDLFALSAATAERTVFAEGPVAFLPPPSPPALVARAGFAALPLDGGRGAATAPSIVAVDVDSGGGVAVSGFARPRTAVRLVLDGAPAGVAQVDSDGRFAVVAASPARTGRRRVEIQAEGGAARADVEVVEPSPIQAPFQALRTPQGWRIDWRPAGGGLQTTLVLEPARKSAP